MYSVMKGILYATNTKGYVEKIDLSQTRTIALVGSIGTGKTTLIKQLLREVRDVYPESKIVVLDMWTEYMDIASSYGLNYVELVPCLDPIKLYKKGVISDHELAQILKEYGYEPHKVLKNINKIDTLDLPLSCRSFTFDIEVNQVVNLARYNITKLQPEEWMYLSFLTLAVIRKKMTTTTDTIFVVDNGDFYDPYMLFSLMKSATKSGNIFVFTVRKPYPMIHQGFGNVIMFSDVVFLFRLNDTIDLDSVAKLLGLDHEDVERVASLRPLQSVVVKRRKAVLEGSEPRQD